MLRFGLGLMLNSVRRVQAVAENITRYFLLKQDGGYLLKQDGGRIVL